MDSAAHRVPNELCVSETPIRRVLVIGSCLTAGYAIAVPNLSPGTLADHILVNNFATLPAAPPAPFADYDFQVIQLPIRSILPDHAMFRTPPEIKAWEQVFEDCCNRMTQMLDTCLQWSREQGLLTFVYNFMTPQQSAMGRTFPRYDLRNPIHLIERLNQRLAEAISDVPNVHLFDIDSIAATIGRRYVQDDVIAITNHGATVGDDEFLNHDQARLELPERPTRVFDQRGWEFLQTIWAELRALYRTCRQADQVKLVLIDLDDTLWRGVLAETDQTNIEGWPLGFAEALMFLKRRGMILGIVSKNSQERVEELWRRHIGDRIRLSDFAVKRINWSPKPDNISEILADVNLLPKSVLFIDDNPVERDAVKQAFPDMRVIGSNPYLWRRILLWSPETQVVEITDESARRSDMIEAQVQRETARRTLSREEFLGTLGVKVALEKVASADHGAYARTFELLNKTNQFNTTGRRWSSAEAFSYFEDGGAFYALSVSDRHTDYGIVGVLCAKGARIDQFVLSCRVIGLDVELAAVSLLLAQMPSQDLTAAAIETEANLLSRDIWTRCGFEVAEDGFRRAAGPPPPIPPHITTPETVDA